MVLTLNVGCYPYTADCYPFTRTRVPTNRCYPNVKIRVTESAILMEQNFVVWCTTYFILPLNSSFVRIINTQCTYFQYQYAIQISILKYLYLNRFYLFSYSMVIKSFWLSWGLLDQDWFHPCRVVGRKFNT